MSEQKHTPGPWFVLDRVSQNDSRSLIYSQREEYTPSEDVALVGAVSPNEQQANAKLIAAAPELLEALKETKASIERMPKGIGRGAMAPLYEQVCNAIAKATGAA